MTTLEFGPLWRETLRLMAQSGWRLALAMVVLTLIPVLGETALELRDQSGVNILISFVSLFLQTWLTVALLEAHDCRRGRAGAVTVFGIGLVGGLGIILGLLLLVIPGIFLIVRWSISVPLALAEDVGVTDSLRASYEETEGAFWPILLLLLTCYAPCALALGAAFLLETQSITIVSSVIVNVLVNVGLVAGWHAAVAIYLTKRAGALPEVFA